MSAARFFPETRYWLCLGAIVGVMFVSLPGHSDIVTLKDGASFRCEVISETQSPDTGARFLQIKINNAVSWLNWDAVERIDRTTLSSQKETNIEAMLDRLIENGTVVPALREQLEFATPPKPPKDEEIPLRVKTIRGWAYLYENMRAVSNRKRTPLTEGSPIPKNYIMILSPNTRVTLEIANLGEIGLEGGTRIRFDNIQQNRTGTYEVIGRLFHGKTWFKIGADQPKWERVILKLNSTRSVIQQALIYVETGRKQGEYDITYLEGEKDLQFWRDRKVETPYAVSVGQTLKVSPGLNRLPAVAAPNAEALLARVKTWDDWQPETLAAEMELVVPPLRTFPSYLAIPALHPYRLTIDQSITMPPEIRSQGAILGVYRSALKRYKFDTGRYPTFDHGLDALVKSFGAASWRGPYIPLELPRKDAWGNDFIYDVYTDNGRQYVDVRSNGPNGKDDKGLDDDVR